jgi:hypothetical protein
MTKRIIAEFVPQAWVNNYAINVDPEGPTTWDVTDYILENYSKERALALKDDDYPTDDLRNHASAPEWVRDWSGPFYVQVADSIEAYFEHVTQGVTS